MSRLATRPKRSYSARYLAKEVGIPLPTTSKILKVLCRSGILESQRGVKGGYRLSRSPLRISVAELVEVLEGPIALTVCSDHSAETCQQEAWCPVRSNWQRISLEVRGALSAISIAEMVAPAHLAIGRLPVPAACAPGGEGRSCGSRME